ncbi:hypothetical protein HSB1_41440 [Halogranum salarium B-1]|uniref:SHOCT domain-containing protein n=1 Tax=Halogranum salarium B-1 TaxID=1210908 RepID=J3JDG0_9EURY|nr:hypothetical protein HSB1_41440 [Halogranum salarium B-1]
MGGLESKANHGTFVNVRVGDFQACERYARGELSDDEFERRREQLKRAE